MRIIRFLDTDGVEQLGVPDGTHTAERLQGDLYQGLVRTGTRIGVDTLLAPVCPSNIFCIGLNYQAHAEETGAPVPENPVVFMKPTSALSHPEQPILIPACCEHGPEVDFEAELAVILRRAARNVTEDVALDYVLGYTAVNDVSARRWQKHGGGGQWVRGKSFDTFCPMGPVLTTPEDIPDPQQLRVRSMLNGAVMQDGHTSDMIFPVARLVSLLSRDTTLLPGTAILTGTPRGVGFARKPPVFLSSGDRIVIEVEAVGRLANPVLAAAASE
ncbi:MAG: fumarylacetoacetate hydrolase family protein [Gammaproteobacteria bacterium]|nr:fumarylacetoacetate hydrolase family protein [Gammaproteobacteria bacterium]